MTIRLIQSFQNRFTLLYSLLLALLLLVAPSFYQDNLGGEGLFIPFNNVVWIIVALLIGASALVIIRRETIQIPQLTYSLLILVGLTTIAGAINSIATPTAWLFRNLALGAGFFLFIAIAQAPSGRRWSDNALLLVIASGTVQSVYGLIQMLSSASNLPGWLPQSPGIPSGIFQQPNLLASYLATGLAASLFLISSPSIKGRHLLVKMFIIIASGLAAMVIASTGSRIGLLGATAAVTLLFAVRWRQLWRSRTLTMLWCIALATGIAASSIHQGKDTGLLFGLKKFADITASNAEPGRSVARKTIYTVSWELFTQKPVLGHGIGKFERAFHDQKAVYLKSAPDADPIDARLSHPHNELLFWAIEGGMVALSGFFILAGSFLYLIYQLGWQRGGSYLALTLPILLHTQVELPLYISHLHWSVLVILIALAARHRSKKIKLPFAALTRPTLLGLSVALPVVATIFFSHTLVSGRLLIQYYMMPQKPIELLEIPRKNLYLNNYADYAAMQALAKYGLSRGDSEVLRNYILWAQQILRVTPYIPVYATLAAAHHSLGEYDKNQQVMAEALAIYPRTNIILQAKNLFDRLDQEAGRGANEIRLR